MYIYSYYEEVSSTLKNVNINKGNYAISLTGKFYTKCRLGNYF